MNDQVNDLLSQVEQQIHGPGREEILGQLEQDPSASKLAEVTYSIIMSLDTQASEAGIILELDVILGVATETFDMLIEIIEAMGQKINPDELRNQGLIELVMLYMKDVEGDPEAEAAAKELLDQMIADGTMDQGMQHIDSMAEMSTDEMRAAGQQMSQPQQKPIAAGVRQGLMQ